MKRARPQSKKPEPKSRAAALAEASAAYAQRAWNDAYLAFERVEADAALDDEALEKMGWAASLSGRDPEALVRMERLYHKRLAAEQLPGAARTAFWIGVLLQGMREATQAGAWFQRGQRLLARLPDVYPEQGYLLASAVQRRLLAGDSEGAYADASEAVALGERFRDPDLIALGRQLQGRTLVHTGEIERGLDLLDEVMLAGTRGELSPTVTGIVYCGVMACFQQVFALKRAREWTSAIAAWCEGQPQLVPFAGACRVHRAEILQLCGDWQQAGEEALRCTQRNHAPGADHTVADAHYQRAEIARLRGELEIAEELYRLASESGREPQPGLSLLRLAQGERSAAQAAIRRVLAATPEALRRAHYLPAFVEIMLATGELEQAQQGALELEAIAAQVHTEALQAIAAHARGAVALAQGDPSGALGPLRASFAVWQQLSAPYLAARVRVLIGRACAALGDHDGEALEFDAARGVFEQLGADRDLRALDAASKLPEARTASALEATSSRAVGLTARELEVLRLVAAGNTNKEIAAALFLSEKTVDRHVSNIFDKLGVRTRSAATAFAYANRLVDDPR